MVTGQASNGTPAASPQQPRTSRPVSSEEIGPVEGLETTNGAPPARATPHSSMNELEFLNTVVGQSTDMPAQQLAPGTARPTPNTPVKRAAPTPSAPRPMEPVKPPEPKPAPSPDAVKVDPDGAEDLGESLLSRVKSGGSTLREETDAESLLNGTKQPGTLRPLPSGAKPTGSNPAAPASAADRHKTLKCGECGAMNFPTEWYCERCGAELSAV